MTKKRQHDILEEEAHESFQDWSQIKRLAKYLAPRKKAIALGVGLSILLSLLILIPSVLLKMVIDDYVVPGRMGGLVVVLGILAAVMVLTLAIEACNTYLIAKIGQESMRDLRMDLMEHLQKQSASFFDKKAVGWLVTRITSDINVLNELFSQGVIGIFQQLFMLFGVFAILFWFNPVLALWTLAVVPLVLLLSWWFRGRIRVGYRLTRLRLSRLNTHVQENVSGMKVVQANTRQARQFDQFEELNDLHRDAHNRTLFAYAVYFPVIEIISALGIALIIWQGGHQFLAGHVTVGELFLFVTLLERFFAPVRDLSEKYNLLQSAMAAGERVFKLMDSVPDIADPAEPTELTAFKGSIEFEDVWFAYNDEDWILKGVSFRIEPGQTVAIVGPTGSGKTTLMSLLCRFYDVQRGRILVDGVDIRQMRQAELRRRIAIVLQDVFLFRGTVAENIRLGNTAIDDATIRRVAQAVHADSFIDRLPEGYDARVMERGATLSVGQRQLLAFARALAFDPEILILDEATSNIDTETEKLIQDALLRLTAGRTSVVIAHRLSTIQRADNILVLRHGELMEQGTHRELLQRDGLYRRLFELQYREQATA
jgi:ATP-binding cassette subfamily B multidrug efflux pump